MLGKEEAFIYKLDIYHKCMAIWQIGQFGLEMECTRNVCIVYIHQ